MALLDPILVLELLLLGCCTGFLAGCWALAAAC
jgi:hypothetical protein